MSGSRPAFAALLSVVLLQHAQGHGTMMEPVPRQPESLYWYQVGCMIGCTCSGGGKETYPSLDSMNCKTPATPTLTKASELTWNANGASPMGDWNKYMPWRAPGTSKPLDSCGIASGFDPQASVQFPHQFSDASIKQGMKGTEIPAGKVTVWKAGTIVQTSYRLVVNHGGGYQYRVCPKTELPNEACFQANPLSFANGKTTVVYRNGTRITLNAVDITTGVQPAGHAWRRLPLPACNCDFGSSCQNITLSGGSSKGDYVAYATGVKPHGHCSLGLQFDAPHLRDGTWMDGFGYHVAQLGGKTGQNSRPGDKCSGHADESTCNKDTTDCIWYDGKGCSTKSSADPAAAEGSEKCSSLKDEKDCEAASAAGCSWYGSKNQCHLSKGGRRLDFSGAGAKDESFHEWWFTDELKAPSKAGDYILQWRWDNEQTPQIWTTCADIRVESVDSTTSTGANGATSASIGHRVAGAVLALQMILAAQLAKLL